jgi:hypothetical protein
MEVNWKRWWGNLEEGKVPKERVAEIGYVEEGSEKCHFD